MPIVRRGAPFGRNVGPLQGMQFPTVEGRLKLGYHRGNGIGLLLPIDPTVPIPSTVPRKATVHGIGAFTRGRGLGGVSISPASSSFRVGDPYTITVTGGMPNATVGLNASQCSPDFSRCTISPMSGQQDVALSNWMGRPMTGNEPGGIGKTDGNGNFSMSGTFTPAQVGLWTQTWNVGGVLMGLPQFTVSDPSGSTAYGGPVTPSGVPYYTLAQNNAPSATYTPAQLAAMAGSPAPASPPAAPPVIPPPSGGGGTFDTSGNGGGGSSSGFDLSSIPTWAWLAGAGIGAFLLFRGHH